MNGGTISPICFFGVACPAGVEPATYGLEGLANLEKTISDNDINRPNLGVRRNRGRRGVGWGQILGSWCRQALVDKRTLDIKEEFGKIRKNIKSLKQNGNKKR